MTNVVPLGESAKPHACVSCRARKIRCDLADHGTPCSPCQKASLACCEIRPKRRRINVAEVAIASSEAEPTEYALQAARSSSYGSLGEGDDRPQRVHINGSQDISKSDSILLEFLSQDFEEGSIGDYQATFIDDYANVVRILGSTFGRGFRPNIRHFRDAPFIKRRNGSLPRKISEEEQRLLDYNGAFILPDARIAHGFVAAFFDRVYPTMPIVDRATFRTASCGPLSPPAGGGGGGGGGNGGSGPPLLLLQAVLLSGSTVWQHPDLKLAPEEVSQRLFRRAKALVDQRFEQDRLTLVVAHLLFSTFTCDSCDDTIQNMWLSLGSAVRIAQGLGMHRDLGAAAAEPRHRLQWKRIWWTLFLHDTLCAFEWGRPRALHLADSEVDEIGEDDFAPSEPGALPCTEHVAFFIAATELCFIVSDWLDSLRPGGPRQRRRERQQPQPQQHQQQQQQQETRRGDEQSVLRARAELRDWHDRLPPVLCVARENPRYTLWSGTLHVAYHATVIRFYSSAPADARQVHDAAAAITAVCQSLFAQGLLGSVWVYAIHQLYLAMCHHARESRDPDPAVSALGLQNLRASLPLLEQLSQKNSVARQAFVFLNEVAKGTVPEAIGTWDLGSAFHDASQWPLDAVFWRGGDDLDLDLWDSLGARQDGVASLSESGPSRKAS